MDRRERFSDPQTALLAALQGWQAGLWSALPGIVESFDPDKHTVSIQPAIQARVRAADGSESWVSLPLLVDVPVQFPGGGGFILTFPIVKGNEALVVFSSRCIDSWYQSGGVQNQAELRMHDLSDGFALPGIRSLPHVIPGGVNTTRVQLRSDSGNVRVELDPAGGGFCNIVAPGGITLAGPVNVVGTLKNNGIDVGSTHTHGGITRGGAFSNAPI
jgi:hypothetical protein